MEARSTKTGKAVMPGALGKGNDSSFGIQEAMCIAAEIDLDDSLVAAAVIERNELAPWEDASKSWT
jgi:hypothetical protein